MFQNSGNNGTFFGGGEKKKKIGGSLELRITNVVKKVRKGLDCMQEHRTVAKGLEESDDLVSPGSWIMD